MLHVSVQVNVHHVGAYNYLANTTLNNYINNKCSNKLNQGGLGMNKEVYVVRLIDRDNSVDELIAVIKHIDVVDKIAYKLNEEQGLEFETLASTWNSKFWKFQCLTCESCYLMVNKVQLVE